MQNLFSTTTTTSAFKNGLRFLIFSLTHFPPTTLVFASGTSTLLSLFCCHFLELYLKKKNFPQY